MSNPTPPPTPPPASPDLEAIAHRNGVRSGIIRNADGSVTLPYGDAVWDDVSALVRRVRSLEHQVRGYQAEVAEADQHLGKALHYPAAGPEIGGDGNAVFTGEHTLASLAEEAAERIRTLEAANAALREVLRALRDTLEEATPSGDAEACGFWMDISADDLENLTGQAAALLKE